MKKNPQNWLLLSQSLHSSKIIPQNIFPEYSRPMMERLGYKNLNAHFNYTLLNTQMCNT